MEAAKLEEEFAKYMGTKFCAAINSCGCALFLALKSVGVEFGEEILMNAFTLAPVPGAISHCGAKPVLVEVLEGTFTIDFEDLAEKAKKIKNPSGRKYLLVSHMRGHICDLEKLAEICEKLEIVLIEDCAHTMGASWNDKLTGTFGKVSCFSTQTFKHVNSGEGGLLVTDDEDIAAKVILYRVVLG